VRADTGTYCVVLWLDVPLFVRSLEVGDRNFQRGLVIKETDQDIESTKNSQTVSLKLWRVDVVSVHTVEIGPGLRVVAEQPAMTNKQCLTHHLGAQEVLEK